MFKSGYVAIIGQTNAGKSTLLNKILNENVSIISNKVQTTRKNISGIYTDDSMQIVFIDTPGIHKVNSKLSTVMIGNAYKSLKDANIVIYLVAGNKKELSPFDYAILKELRQIKKPVICCINKIDRLKKPLILEKISLLSSEYDFKEIIPISAINGEGVDILMEKIKENLKEGPMFFDPEIYTTQTVREMSEDIIRQKALKFLREEIPHGLLVQIESFKEKQKQNGKMQVDIEATIITKKESHKGIIIGKNGETLKKISTFARKDLEAFLDAKVNLKVWVKVRKNWLDNDLYLNRFREK